VAISPIEGVDPLQQLDFGGRLGHGSISHQAVPALPERPHGKFVAPAIGRPFGTAIAHGDEGSLIL